VNDADGALDAFRRIYRTDHWKGGSGEGSHVDATVAYRQVLEAVAGASDVGSIVDAGCGDWQFSRLVNWSGARYTGIDIVPEVVAVNTESFGTDRLEFFTGDIRTQVLPRADLLICKDVLQHWDIDSIRAFLARNLGRYRYALITNDVSSVHIDAGMLNAEIALGAWRPVDLERPPFAARPRWSFDFAIRDEWIKRTSLFVRRRDRAAARLRRGSAYRICRSL